MTDYLELAKSVVAKATEASGAEVEVYINSGKETDINISGGEVEQLSQSSSQGMGIRVLKNGQTGYAYTSDFSEKSLEETWRAAVDLADVASPDEYRKLPDPEPIPDEDLKIWDETLADVSVEEKIALAIATEKAALDYDERIFLATALGTGYGDAIINVYLANSKGFAESYGRTIAYGSVWVTAKGEDGEMVNGSSFGASNFFKDLNPKEIGERAGKKAISILGGKPVPTQKASVVLDHIVGAQIIGTLAQALSADNWQKQRSFLKDSMGQEVGSSMVTLMSNGRLEGGLGSAPFDAEGVPTKAVRLIDEGVLQSVMHNSYTAAKEGQMSTGNATRSSYRNAPGLGSGNFYIQAGNKSPEEIIKDVDTGFYVLNVMQTGGINPITGECSMMANGLWIENGELKQAVGGVTIATTLQDLLQNVSDVGNDMMQVPFFGALGVPTMRVDNVTIGGSEN